MNKNTNVMLQASLANAIRKTVEDLTTVIVDMYALDQYNQAIYELEKIRDTLTEYRTNLIDIHEKSYEEIKYDATFIYNEINDKEEEK